MLAATRTALRSEVYEDHYHSVADRRAHHAIEVLVCPVMTCRASGKTEGRTASKRASNDYARRHGSAAAHQLPQGQS
jgi:hypothetical protein